VGSVHLESWPEVRTSLVSKLFKNSSSKKVVGDMENVRKIVTLGLEARQKTGIKVRQPLATLKIKSGQLSEEYLELIKEELNVKGVIFDSSIESEVWLDIRINEELKAEGEYRELVRALQDLRKKTGLTPSDVISLIFETSKKGEELVEKFSTDMKKTVLVSKIEFAENDGEQIKIDNLEFRIKIDKI
jgi:isoleucyl-tRNA synthetase